MVGLGSRKNLSSVHIGIWGADHHDLQEEGNTKWGTDEGTTVDSDQTGYVGIRDKDSHEQVRHQPV